MNCRIDERLRVDAQLLTFNRDVVDQIVTESYGEDLVPLIQNVAGDRFKVCVGFRELDNSDIFSRMKKSDYNDVSICRFSNDVVYRARLCNFVVDTSEDETSLHPNSRCCECRQFFNELDVKYFQGKLSQQPEPPPDLSENFDSVEAEKRKRGRPKGSKKKNILSEPEIEPEVDTKEELFPGEIGIKSEFADQDPTPQNQVNSHNFTIANSVEFFIEEFNSFEQMD